MLAATLPSPGALIICGRLLLRSIATLTGGRRLAGALIVLLLRALTLAGLLSALALLLLSATLRLSSTLIGG